MRTVENDGIPEDHSMPFVSIGMPVYNCATKVGHAIASIVRQTNKQWELIVIDDGSTDGTADVVRKFRDPRIRLILEDCNRGLPVRLNQAVALSKGEYFARMDGDDVCYPHRLQTQLTYLNQHPEVDLLGAGIVVFGSSGHAIGHRGGVLSHEAICGNPWRGFVLPHVTWMGKTSWFRANRYDEDAYYCQDRELLLRTHRQARFSSVPEVLVAVREDVLSTRKLLRARRINFRYLIREGVRQYRSELILIAAPCEILKAGLDWLAVKTGLKYKLLRHRVPKIAPELATGWTRLKHSLDSDLESLDYLSQVGRSSSPHPKAPLVSIAMPVFNSEATIIQAVQSIQSQTYENWELLVMDDGSSDGTISLLRSVQDSRIRIHTGAHLGLSTQLNRAVQVSRGKYFARMDADDISYPERISRQIQFLRCQPQLDLIAAWMLIFRTGGKVIGQRVAPPTHEQLCSRAWNGIPMAHPTWMGKIEWFRGNPYCADANRMEDRELLFRTYRRSRFGVVPEILLGYREDSLSLRRLMVARKNTCKSLIRYSAESHDFVGGGLGTISEICKFMLDAVAIGSGLDYHLLKSRARAVKQVEIDRWDGIWKSALAVSRGNDAILSK
jgi:glycosyltransferase involved in cell wall biosynthesis